MTTTRPVGLVCAPAAFGGAQRYLLSLLHHLDAVLLPVTPVEPQLASGAAGRPVVPVAGAHGLAAARGAGVGALHVNATDPVAEADLLRAAAATGLPVTATVHMTDTYARSAPPPDAAQLWRSLAGVVAPSRRIAEHLVGARGVPEELVAHVPNGVAERPALPARPARAPGAPLRVACCARLTPQKGLDVLVDAVGLLERERPGAVEVVVAGEGRERGALVRRSRGLPVTWLGHADDVDAVLAGADAYVQPSREDALPLALLEALLAGLPSAATDVGDVRELLGGAVLLVDVEDAAGLAAALGRLVAEPALRDRLRRAGRARAVEGHTDAVMAARTAAVLGPAWGWPAERALARAGG